MAHDQSSIPQSVNDIDCTGRIGGASSTEGLQVAMRRSHDPEEV